jgi:hypothetical protein
VALSSRGALLHFQHVLPTLDRLPVQGQEHVSGPEARAIRRRAGGDLGRYDAGRALDPQHAVFNLIGGGPKDDVADAKRQQDERDRHRHDRADAVAPTDVRFNRRHDKYGVFEH